MKTKIFVIPSTHWDREWFLPFEKFRFKLVRLTDRLLDILENNENYKYFHFDGQTTVIDDYLEIRPENRERVISLIKQGRILVGPFRNMLDCLLLSGEAITRNLQKGLSDCNKWGVAPHSLGYTCDTFGHNAQMPQIYDNFDIKHCLMLRGRAGYEDNKFIWEGADGSTVTAFRVHPDYNYSDFYLIARWPMQKKEKFDLSEKANAVKEHLDEYGKYIKGNCHCMIDGYDNLEPDERLPEIIDYLNKNNSEYEFVLSNFTDYCEEVDKFSDEYSKHSGIIYTPEVDGTGCFLMKNVASSIVTLKQENSYAEDLISLVAEPLDAYTEITRKGERLDYYPPKRTGFFNYAWDKIVNNHPHDTIGGTCVGDAHLDNFNDYKRARENIEVALQDCLREISLNAKVNGKGKDGAFIIYNPSQIDINGVKTVKLKFKSGVNVKEAFIYQGENLIPHTVLEKTTAIEQIAEFKKMADYVEYDTYTLAMPLKISAYSFCVITYDLPKFERDFDAGEWLFSRYDKVRRDYSSMAVGVNSFDNGVLRVEINPNGSLKVIDKTTKKEYPELFLFEDDSDFGEGWNHRKTLLDQKISSKCINAQSSILVDNSTVARFKVDYVMRLPITCDSERRSEILTDFKFSAIYTIYNGSKSIDCKINVDNNVKNHRMRVVFPTFINAKDFYTSMPYDMQKWKVEKGYHDYDTEPFSPVVVGQGLINIKDEKDSFSVYTKGLYEFEVADREDRAISITLFRSVPKETFFLESHLAQVQGNLSFEISLDFEKGKNSELIKRSSSFRTGILSDIKRGEDGEVEGGNIITVSGNAVLSSFRMRDLITGEPTVRIYDVDGGSEGEIIFPKALKTAYRVKQNGKVCCDVKFTSNKLKYKLKAKEIATFKVTFSEN